METVITVILFINIVLVILYFIMRINKHTVDTSGKGSTNDVVEKEKQD